LTTDVVIVGAGHGGTQAAVSLRQHGFEGSIALITDETELPYERPPLSKEYLAGERAFDHMLLHPATTFSDRNIQLLTDKRVTAVDPLARSLSLEDGTSVRYQQLIWAAGGKPRRLMCEGGDAAGVYTIRTRADVDSLRNHLNESSHVAVIGGGYIGLEAAAVMTKLGKKVTVVEALDRVLARVAGEPISRFYEAEHRRQGVDLRTGAQVTSLECRNGKVTAIHCGEGSRIACDLVIAAVGIEPSIEPLRAAGADGSNGVDVDECCRTSLPGVFAIGDCAAHENSFAGGARVRLESVQNATDQATTVAKVIAGDEQPYSATPWFWSNQYDLRLQTVGLSIGSDDMVVRGDPDDRSFSVIYLRGDKVVALDCVNLTKDYVQGRKLIEAKISAGKDALANQEIPLKSLLLS
jgi:3-phenylpropionate/trans-cinnamate dioxygenase ferredoxin reductase subunit